MQPLSSDDCVRITFLLKVPGWPFAVENVPCLELRPQCASTLFLIYPGTKVIHIIPIVLRYIKKKKMLSKLLKI